jgi:hypothetical protein
MTAVVTAGVIPPVSGGATPRRPFRPAAPRARTSRLRTLPVPATEPPVEHGEVRGPSPHHPAQGVLALQAYDADDDELWGRQPTPSHDLPDPAQWGRTITQVLVEVLAGHRPSAQLLRWTTEQVYREVRNRALPLPSGRDRSRSLGPAHRPRVGSVRVSEPRDGVAEVAAVVHRRHRVQAMALRLEGRDGRWVVTVLQHA